VVGSLATPDRTPGALPPSQKCAGGLGLVRKMDNRRAQASRSRAVPRRKSPLTSPFGSLTCAAARVCPIRGNKATRQARHHNVDGIARTLPTHRRLLPVSRVASPAVARSIGTPSEAWLELCLHRRSVAFQGTPRASRASYVAPLARYSLLAWPQCETGGLGEICRCDAYRIELCQLFRTCDRIGSERWPFSTRAIGVHLF
jgi:hypothetical protein